MTLKDIERRNFCYVTLRYFIEFGKPVFPHVTASICGEFMHKSIVFCSACSRRYESSRSLSLLLMSFLSVADAAFVFVT